jgi:hypothetical protein
VGIGVAVLLLAMPAVGQELKTVGEIRSKGLVTSEVSKKIVSRLRGLIADSQALGIKKGYAGGIDAAQRFSSDTLKVDNAGRVQIYVSVTDTSAQALDTLRRHGLDIEVVNDGFGIVQGWIPTANLEALAAEPVVVKVRPPSYATPDTGPVTSQGDSILRCDQARSLGLNGAGVKVGVISTGVSGLSASQTAGELGPVQVLSAGNGDEGTAMLEIIADCAPGAALAFAGPTTSLEFVQAVNALQSAAAQIIVDDIAAFLTEPIFEDSITALNDRTVGAAVLRVSSAGNRGLAHHIGTFTPGTFDAQVSGTRHNFGGGDELLRFQVPGGSSVGIFLQWGNQFGTAADDYDLCIRRTDGSLLGCSATRQDGSDDPLEALSLLCTAPPGSFCLADIQVTLFSGATRTFALFCDLPCQFSEFNHRYGSVVGHKAVPEVLAVAAASAGTPTIVEPYSSAGPTIILFPSVQSRAKPDLTGVDCVATSRPGFNPFCGTSAAAPHVAGVAAILLQRMGPGTTVQALAGALKATTTDLGPPGFDFDFGAGRADALTAVQSPLLGPNPVAAVLPSSRSVQVGATAVVFGAIINAGFITAVGCGVAPTTSIPATFVFQTTDPATNQVTGTPNAPVNITGRAVQTYVLAFTPTAPFVPTDVRLSFNCGNSNPAPVNVGLNTVLLSASATPVPDVMAIGATLTGDGIVNIPGTTGTGVFAVATVNFGVGSSITVSADTGGIPLPISIQLCETNPATGQCVNPPVQSTSPVIANIGANATPTFGIFVVGTGRAVPFDPAANRIFVRFKDAGGVTRGSTSVAVRTQ